ncbi:MAG: anthranilate phosphoribosyltransferase [Neisseriaceae bacterium]|nr:anthranilate phosphoribosyltransferase [Neisseriaceae bacterium]
MITTQEALNRLIDNNELFYDEMTDLMRQIMAGEMPSEVIAALLIGLRIKVETVSEITAATNVMREFMQKVPLEESERQGLVDVVGTGGDCASTFNISTTSMFVAAAAGAKVAKHGGRSVSSQCGAADVMEALGASIELSPQAVAECIRKTNIGFMFAPIHHPAMRHVAPVRRALGVRTMFNILGPLSNPACAPNQVLGVFHSDLLGICIHVLKELKLKHVLVVHGQDGLDEITITAPTRVHELKNNQIEEYIICPEDFGLTRIDSLKPLQVSNAQESMAKMNSVLSGEQGPCRDIVLMNAGATIYCSGVAQSIADGIDMAKQSIDSGNAKRKQEAYIQAASSMQKA